MTFTKEEQKTATEHFQKCALAQRWNHREHIREDSTTFMAKTLWVVCCCHFGKGNLSIGKLSLSVNLPEVRSQSGRKYSKGQKWIQICDQIPYTQQISRLQTCQRGKKPANLGWQDGEPIHLATAGWKARARPTWGGRMKACPPRGARRKACPPGVAAWGGGVKRLPTWGGMVESLSTWGSRVERLPSWGSRVESLPTL
jgi:hypothetical protein